MRGCANVKPVLLKNIHAKKMDNFSVVSRNILPVHASEVSIRRTPSFLSFSPFRRLECGYGSGAAMGEK